MLMLADLESMGQQALLDSGDDVHADILKYPHHGHAAMNQALLTTIAPKLAIITAKPTRAPYALAQLDAMAIPAAHTDECGLLLQTDGQVWICRISRWKNNRRLICNNRRGGLTNPARLPTMEGKYRKGRLLR